ncbi:MAG: DUF4491 family protein [Alistipes sp.]|nr:DUF4491 family protein [Alistipes sp.]
MDLHFTGVVIGVATFIIIGIFHPIVIKAEYYFGVRCWWVFLFAGLFAIIASLLVSSVLISTLLAVVGASSFWSIGELFEQRRRVERGWFPKRDKGNGCGCKKS